MADDNGWIKLHRKLLENPIFLNPYLLQIFIYCLLKANHKDNELIWNGKLETIKSGSFITGRIQMAKDLKQNESALYKRLHLLTNLGYIELKSNNKFTLLTIVKYKTYQITNSNEEQQSNNKVTTKEQQSNTNNNDKNVKNDKKYMQPTLDEVKDYFKLKGYTPETAFKAFEYYSANDWKDRDSKPVKNWKQKMIGVWFKDENKIKESENVIRLSGK